MDGHAGSIRRCEGRRERISREATVPVCGPGGGGNHDFPLGCRAPVPLTRSRQSMRKTVFISGGTSGINLGIALSFARSGAAVLVFGRDGSKASAAAAQIREQSAAPA